MPFEWLIVKAAARLTFGVKGSICWLHQDLYTLQKLRGVDEDPAYMEVNGNILSYLDIIIAGKVRLNHKNLCRNKLTEQKPLKPWTGIQADNKLW
jgi:hypothetical protein